MNEEHREQYLMHYGVLGMKWGIRRKRDKQSSNKKSSKQNFEVKNNIKQPKTNAKAKKVDSKGKKQDFDEDEFLKTLQQLRMQVEYDRLVSTLEANNSTMRKVENITKNVTTVATLTGSALMIYNNLNKAHDIVGTVKRNEPYVPKKKK